MNGFRILSLAKRYMAHDMIQAYTELPAFPKARVELLHAFLSRNEMAPKQSELFALVTLLVQVGLDIHDTIELTVKQQQPCNFRSRQMKVLTGDHLSSQFYNLLAQAGQINGIQILSQTICEMNRLKLTFLNRMKQQAVTAEQYLQISIALQKMLFQSFNHRMNPVEIPLWEQLLDSMTELEVIERERQRMKQYDSFEESWSYWYIWQYGTDEERNKLEQRSYDDIGWNKLITKYNIQEQLVCQVQIIRDKLHKLKTILLFDECMVQIVNAFLYSPVTYLRSAPFTFYE